MYRSLQGYEGYWFYYEPEIPQDLSISIARIWLNIISSQVSGYHSRPIIFLRKWYTILSSSSTTTTTMEKSDRGDGCHIAGWDGFDSCRRPSMILGSFEKLAWFTGHLRVKKIVQVYRDMLNSHHHYHSLVVTVSKPRRINRNL